MQILTKQMDPPVPKHIEGEMFEKLLNTMSSLYDSEVKVLNLEKFHKNEGKKSLCDGLSVAMTC